MARHDVHTTKGGIHTAVAWRFRKADDLAVFQPYEGYPIEAKQLGPGDVGKIALCDAPIGAHMLVSISPIQWLGLGGGGPPGPQGAQGKQGDVGAQGHQGAQGLGHVGAQGSQGEPGRIGDKGPAGDVGPQGSVGAQGAQGMSGAAKKKA